jgi:hypothetical protein
MGALSEWDRRAHRLGIVDVKLFAVSALFAGFVVAKLFPEVLSVNVWAWVVLCVAVALHPLVVLLRRNDRTQPPTV